MARLNPEPQRVSSESNSSSTVQSDDINSSKTTNADQTKDAAITTASTPKLDANPTEDKQSEVNHEDEARRFKPMKSASGHNYSKKKGVARVIKKTATSATRNSPSFVRDQDETSDEDEDVVMQEPNEPVEELPEGDVRRSKRLANKRKRGY